MTTHDSGRFLGISSETFVDLRAYDVKRAQIDRARIAQRLTLLQSAAVKPLVGLRQSRRGKSTSRADDPTLVNPRSGLPP
jgi:hypothetical protein